MNLKKIKHQKRWIAKHERELAAFARSEYREHGRGMLVVCVDGRLVGREETKTSIMYLTQNQAAAANPDWLSSMELPMVTAYDPEIQFVLQFLWATGPGGESRWSTFVWGITGKQNDAAIMERAEIAVRGSELACRTAVQLTNRLSSYNN